MTSNRSKSGKRSHELTARGTVFSIAPGGWPCEGRTTVAKAFRTAPQIFGVIGVAALALSAPSALRADPTNGQAIAQKGTSTVVSCSTCHGLDGEGKVGVGPRLAGQGKAFLLQQLSDFKSGARQMPVMQGVASDLTAAETEDVADYYSTLTAPPHPNSAYRPVSANLVKGGQQIAEQGVPSAGVPACSACHGAGGIGLAPTAPYLAGLQADYMLQQLYEFKDGIRGDPTGLMKPVAAKLSNDDSMAVAEYFASLPAPKRQGEK
jgi:cytochrome c553